MGSYYDRYANFRDNGSMKTLPFLEIPSYSTDKQVLYELGKTRLDKLSNSYYNSPYYGWLIMSANGQYGGLEFNIPDQTVLVLPFPLESALARYQTSVKNYLTYYAQ